MSQTTLKGTMESIKIEEYMQKAAQGDVAAMYNLGFYYMSGRGVAQDIGKAVEWFTKAAENGDTNAMNNLGVCYMNSGKSVEWFTKAAENGNINAMNNLGICYMDGRGVARDDGKAAEWFTKAAERGDVHAMDTLANFYMDGRGVAQDYAKAVEWYTKAAENGITSAMSSLGLCYLNGHGVAQNDGKAVEWFTKGAEGENAGAMCNLGICYMDGRGVAQDDGKAVEWFTKAAENGNINAMNNLGICYMDGRGVAQDDGKAVEWYNKAAERGNANAMCNLAKCYANGRGVQQDSEKAVMWLTKAAENGLDQAKRELLKMNDTQECIRNEKATVADKFQKAYEFLKDAKQSLSQGKSDYALLDLRKCLEFVVKVVAKQCNIAYDTRESTTESLINLLADSGAISDEEKRLMHRIRMEANKGAHIDIDNLDASLSDNVAELCNDMEKLLDLLNYNQNSVDYQRIKDQKNAPMKNPDYYDKNRRFRGQWSKIYASYHNGYRSEVSNLREDQDYVRLERAANENYDIQAMLNLAVGFLPKAEITWGNDQMVCMPPYKAKDQVFFNENDAYDARYYYWVYRAIEAACECERRNLSYPKRYLATAALECLKFNLHVYNMASTYCYIGGVDYGNSVYCDQYVMVKKWYGDFPYLEDADIWNLLEGLIDEGGIDVIASVHGIRSKEDCLAIIEKSKSEREKRRIEAEEAKRLEAERAEREEQNQKEQARAQQESAAQQGTAAQQKEDKSEDAKKECDIEQTQVSSKQSTWKNRWWIILVIVLSVFYLKSFPISVRNGVYCADEGNGSMICVESYGKTGTATLYEADGSVRQWEGAFYRKGFKTHLVSKNGLFTKSYSIRTIGKKIVAIDNIRGYPVLDEPAFEGHYYGNYSVYPPLGLNGYFQCVAELGRESGTAYYHVHTYPCEAGKETIDFSIEEFYTKDGTYFFSPENFCYKAEFTGDELMLTGENGTFIMVKEGTTAAEPFVDDTFDGTLMSLPCIACDGLIAISPKSANSIKLADGGSANSGIFVGDVNALGGYIVYELDGRFSKLSFRDAALQDGSKYIVSYNISGDGREISIADNGDGTYSCDVTNVQELKVKLGYRWGFCGHFMTDVIIE